MTLLEEINSMLNRVPESISTASIQKVREFKQWHSKTTKELKKADKEKMLKIYREVVSIYR